MKALKWCFIAYPCTSLFVSGCLARSLLYFCFSLAAETQILDRTRKLMAAQGSASNHNLLYNKLSANPQLMTDVLMECQGLAWTNRLTRTCTAPSLDWNAIIFVYCIKDSFIPCQRAWVFYKLRAINSKEPALPVPAPDHLTGRL